MPIPAKRNSIPWKLGNLKRVIHVGARYGEELDAYVNDHKAEEIWLFEPMPIHLKDLCEYAESFRDKASITVSNLALGNYRGVSKMTAFRGFSSGLSSLKNIDKHKMLEIFGADTRHNSLRESYELEFTVPVDTLDNLLCLADAPVKPPLDLLSIDTQGFELEVLEGCTKNLPYIRYIICEVTAYPEKSPYLNVHSANEISCFLRSYGFAMNKNMSLWGDFGHGSILFELQK